MISLEFLRNNPDVVKENIKKKFQFHKVELVDKAIELDKQIRAYKQEGDSLRASRNSLSSQIGLLMREKKIDGEEMVENISVYNNKTAETSQLEVNGIFIAVGIIPNTELLKGMVDMDEKGYVLADETGKTSAPGIFVAGDVRRKPMRQIITAVADGANVINAIQNYFIEM